MLPPLFSLIPLFTFRSPFQKQSPPTIPLFAHRLDFVKQQPGHVARRRCGLRPPNFFAATWLQPSSCNATTFGAFGVLGGCGPGDQIPSPVSSFRVPPRSLLAGIARFSTIRSSHPPQLVLRPSFLSILLLLRPLPCPGCILALFPTRPPALCLFLGPVPDPPRFYHREGRRRPRKSLPMPCPPPDENADFSDAPLLLDAPRGIYRTGQTPLATNQRKRSLILSLVVPFLFIPPIFFRCSCADLTPVQRKLAQAQMLP